MPKRHPAYWLLLDDMFAQLEQNLGHPVDPDTMEHVLKRLWRDRSPAQLERMRADLHEWFQRRQHNAN